MRDSQLLFKCLRSLNEFLRENPHLRPFQDEIDKRLKGAGNQQNRMVLLQMMMRDSVKQTSDLWAEVEGDLQNLVKKIEDFKGSIK